MDIKPYLSKHKDTLISELAEFLSKPLPDDVRCVEAMLFRDSLPGVPIWIYFLDRFKGPAKSIKNHELLTELGTLIDSDEFISREDAICDCLDLEGESEQDECMDTVNVIYNELNERVARWFVDCWLEAGGQDYKYHAYLVEEDFQFNPINLRTGVRIKHLHEYSKIFDG